MRRLARFRGQARWRGHAFRWALTWLAGWAWVAGLWGQLPAVRLTTGEWPPYTGEELPHGGLLTRMVELAMANMGEEAEVRYLPFFIGYNRTLEGDHFATFPYVKTPERLAEMRYSDLLAEIDLVMFYKRGAIPDPARLDTVEEFSELRIGRVVGYQYEGLGPIYQESEGRYSSEVMAFRALERGEVDLVPASRQVGVRLIRELFNDYYRSYDYLPNWSLSQKVFLVVPRAAEGGEEWLRAFNESLAFLKEKGTVDELLSLAGEETLVSSIVRLVNNTETHPLVIARDEPNAEEGYVVARGTRAVVLQWSQRFTEAGEVRVFDEMFAKSRVRIIEGPLKGKVVWVENMFIEVE